jgi:hypothetical protein
MNVKIALCAIFIVMGAPFLVEAKYDMSSYTIDNGGGVSTGGAYIVRGTIGQPDATYSADGQYEVLGGFWPGEPSCVIDFEHFAKFAKYWLESGTNLPADLYEDETVDLLDLEKFVEDWLWYCPYGWPLR